MLAYFPTPYPDEWWYSVFCRYYIRFGWERAKVVLDELNNGRRITHGTLFPNSDCYLVLKNIPDGIFSLRDMLISNSLMPYFIRFYPANRKKEVLNNLLSDKGITASLLSKINNGKSVRKLKFCPICYEEDKKNYGEPYWHREHQIPLISICPIHKIRLNFITVPTFKLRTCFFPLYSISNASKNTQTKDILHAWELPLTDKVVSILNFPFEIGPTFGYSNLKNVLFSKGFGSRAFRHDNALDTKKLRQHCIEYYGEDLCKTYFRNFTVDIVNTISNWECFSPERYALLMVIADLSIEELFGPEIPITDPILEKVLEYKDKSNTYWKNDFAHLLGINSSQLDSLVSKYGITPFWKQQNISRPEFISFQLSREEKQKLNKAVLACGNGPKLEFARNILLREAKRILEENDEETGN